MELTQAEEILAQHTRFVAWDRSKSTNSDERIECKTPTLWYNVLCQPRRHDIDAKQRLENEFVHVSRRCCFLAETDDDHADEPTCESMINHDLVLVGLTQNRSLLGNQSLENRGGCALASRIFRSCFWILVELQLATGANSAVVLELLSISRYGWSLDVIWTSLSYSFMNVSLAKEQFTNKLLRCTYKCFKYSVLVC